MDRAKLEAAIRWARGQEEIWRVKGTSPYMESNYGVLAAAAEAHLATLPKMKTAQRWKVEWTYKGYPGGYQMHDSAFDSTEHYRRMAARPDVYTELKLSGPHDWTVLEAALSPNAPSIGQVAPGVDRLVVALPSTDRWPEHLSAYGRARGLPLLDDAVRDLLLRGLATLPKTKTVYEVCATGELSNVYDDVDYALDVARGHLRHGRVVRLSRLEIPA